MRHLLAVALATAATLAAAAPVASPAPARSAGAPAPAPTAPANGTRGMNMKVRECGGREAGFGCVGASARTRAKEKHTVGTGPAVSPCVGGRVCRRPPSPLAFTRNQSHNHTHTHTPQAALADVPFIPLEDLYAPPVATDPKLSPDGDWLAYLAPEPASSTLNVYVTRVDHAAAAAASRGERPDEAKRPPPIKITNATKADIAPGQYLWTSDSKGILFLADPKGGDRYKIYAVSLSANGSASTPRDLVPLASAPRPPSKKAPAQVLPKGLTTGTINVGEFFLSDRVPGGALVTLDERSPGLFDVYRLNTTTGTLALDTTNPGDVGASIPDKWLRVRGARALTKGGGGTLRVRTVRGGFDNDTLVGSPADDGPTTEWRDVASWSADDTFLPVSSAGHAFAFTDTGAALYVLTSVGADYVRLVKVCVRERERESGRERDRGGEEGVREGGHHRARLDLGTHPCCLLFFPPGPGQRLHPVARARLLPGRRHRGHRVRRDGWESGGGGDRG